MEKPIKVLEMIAALNFGGSQAMIVNLCRSMNKQNIQCDFIVDHPEYMGMQKVVEEMGSRIFILPTFKGYNISDIRSAWDDFLDEHPEYKILHSHSRSYASLYLPIARKHGLKTIIHSHNTSNGKGLSAIVKGILQYPLRYLSDYYIGCSKESGEWLFGKKIVKSNRFFVLNNAIDTDKFVYNEDIRNEYRKQFNLENEKVFIQVGRLDEQKNHMFTLNVFRSYLKEEPDAKLFIIGNGVLKEKIEKKIDEYNIRKNVVMLEKRYDVNNLLQMADVFLMPSFYEGLSVAAIEAQASGMKCLCSDKVDRDVDITGLCDFIELDEDKWIEKMKEDLTLRLYTKEDIIKAGYDVKNTALWLEDFYQKIVQ